MAQLMTQKMTSAFQLTHLRGVIDSRPCTPACVMCCRQGSCLSGLLAIWGAHIHFLRAFAPQQHLWSRPAHRHELSPETSRPPSPAFWDCTDNWGTY